MVPLFGNAGNQNLKLEMNAHLVDGNVDADIYKNL